MILNNNPPEITFVGSSEISFMEGASVPLALGSVVLPVISDADNTDVFPMESASVELDGAMDGMDELLTYDRDTLSALNITVNNGMV